MLKVLMASLLVLSSSAMAQLPKRLDSLMRATTQTNQPGAALFVMADNKLVYQQGYGLANVAEQTAITPTTNFRMASVSKQFTAMGILLLEKEGKLSLADPIAKFFPTFNQAVSSKVQIRHLLTHSSGLIDYEEVMSTSQQNQLLDADVLTLIKDRNSLYFDPGTKFRYSNSAYCLLALIIEHLSKQSFVTFLNERIFRPLAMKQTVVYEAGKQITNRAMGYRANKNGFEFSDQSVTSATKGDGGVYTSLEDYQKWNVALRNNTLLDLNATLNRTGFAIPQAAGNYYGAGWFYRQPNHPILFHSGSTCGFNNYVIAIPSKNFLMAYFSNKANNKINALNVVKILTEAGYTELADILNLDDLTQ